jgi:hypothetical protein
MELLNKILTALDYAILDSDRNMGQQLLWLLNAEGVGNIHYLQSSDELGKLDGKQVDILFVRLKNWNNRIVEFVEQRKGQVAVVFICGRNPKYFQQVKEMVADVIGYPFEKDEVMETLQELLQKDMNTPWNWQFIFIRDNELYIKLYHDDILGAKLVNGKWTIAANNRAYMLDCSLKELFEHIPQGQFKLQDRRTVVRKET